METGNVRLIPRKISMVTRELTGKGLQTKGTKRNFV